jgi:hypothetical protein
VTGCPKSSALELIAALEPVGRGASMGALGRIYANGDLDLALTIRTFAVADGTIHLWVGGGIVWDSEADAEIEESWVKARPLLAPLRQMSSASLAAAKRRDAASSVAPIASAIEAPCVLASLAFRAPVTRQHSPERR